MDSANATKTSSMSGLRPFGAAPILPAQREKISCSVPGFSDLEPLDLIGKYVHFLDRSLITPVTPDPQAYDAKVVAVHLGSLEDGIETSLLLRKCDDAEALNYVNVSDLTVQSLLR